MKYKVKHKHGTAIVKAETRLQAQIKFRKKYKLDFISIKKV